MLTRTVQPTSATARHTRRLLSATCCVFTVLAAVLSPLALPVSVSAEGSAAAASGSGAWPWPLLGEVVTSYRNGSDPYAAGQHRGLDIAAPAGSPVLAIVEGHVSFSGRLPDGGETVTVRSGDGTWLVSALHLSERAVSRGARVRAGERLGSVGTSGKRSVSQPHLHLSVRRADTRAYVDPLTLLGPPRLPTLAQTVESPAATEVRPAAPAVRGGSDSVRVTPLETGQSRVRAQSTGDAAPATRHGAHAGSSPARGSAGAPAREGHAAEQATSRVAPPPLKVVTSSDPVPKAGATPVRRPAAVPERKDGPSRLLLAVIAAVCLIALVLRRRPRSRAIAPGGASPDRAVAETGDVIAIAPRRRSA